MKYAVISDIHSNLEALRAVLDDAMRFKPDEVISLGDVVGYGGSPNECVEVLRERSVTSIIGNHDMVAAGLEEPVNFNPLAREAVLWTRETLTVENRDYLAGLPEKRDYENFTIVHGALSHPDKYILGRFEAETEFTLMGDKSLCFFGHTHVPVVYSDKDESSYSLEAELALEAENKYLINPGSVGQPRDRDPRASYLIYDSPEQIEFRKVEYDIEAAQKKVLDSGLPGILAERLQYGY